MVVLVVAGASYGTWRFTEHYWGNDSYRVVAANALYVATDLGEACLNRFRARFQTVTVVDVRSDGERTGDSAGTAATLAELQRLERVRRIPLAPGTLPSVAEVMEFLSICNDASCRPVLLYGGKDTSSGPEIRTATLESAYGVMLRGQTSEDALAGVGLKGSPREGEIRALLESLPRGAHPASGPTATR